MTWSKKKTGKKQIILFIILASLLVIILAILIFKIREKNTVETPKTLTNQDLKNQVSNSIKQALEKNQIQVQQLETNNQNYQQLLDQCHDQNAINLLKEQILNNIKELVEKNPSFSPQLPRIPAPTPNPIPPQPVPPQNPLPEDSYENDITWLSNLDIDFAFHDMEKDLVGKKVFLVTSDYLFLSNAYSRILRKGLQEKCHGCIVAELTSKTFLYEYAQKLTKLMSEDPMRSNREIIGRWALERCKNLPACSGNCPDLIFQMVNKNSAFWSLLVWVKGAGFKFYDPEGATFPAVANNFPEFNIKLETPIRLQKDSCNCGIWVIAFTRLLLERYKRNGYSLAGMNWQIKSEEELILPIKKERASLWKKKGSLGM